MTGPEASCPELFVQPGESHLVRGRAILRTLLGSCVGVTFWHPRLEIGALCHPMLPHCSGRHADQPPDLGRRYVDFAISDLASQFRALGARPEETEVKLFGGADVLMGSNGAGRRTVGSLNGEAALRCLRSEGFRIAASRLGGLSGVHLTFLTETGEVRVRPLEPTGAPRRAVTSRQCSR
ncbi:MAG TPA: chemotaxis protein CheD [Acidobacteriaceae bacterium]